MHAFGQFVGNGFIDLSLTLDTVKPVETSRYDPDAEMRLAAFPRARMPRVLRAFVLD
jgi:hypothetical protein